MDRCKVCWSRLCFSALGSCRAENFFFWAFVFFVVRAVTSSSNGNGMQNSECAFLWFIVFDSDLSLSRDAGAYSLTDGSFLSIHL